MKVFIDEANHKLIVKELDLMEHRALENYLNLYTDKHRYDPRFKAKIWDGKIHQYREDRIIDLGLWKEVAKCCGDLGYPLIIENKHDFPLNRELDRQHFSRWVQEFFKNRKTKDGEQFFPRDYQIHAAYEILRNRYCNIEVATAGGKTLVYAMVAFYIIQYLNPKAKLLLIVPSITLVTQFYNDLIGFNWGTFKENKNPCKLEMEEVMSETPRKPQPGRHPNIWIATYQSLAKYPDKWFSMFYGITVDECHGAKNTTQQHILKSSLKSAYYRFGMSGTYPNENSADWLMVQAVTGPIVKEVKGRQLMDEGYITPVKIKSMILNHCDHDFHEKIMVVKKADPKAAYLLEKAKIQESEKRLDFIKKIATLSTSNMLILFENIEHGQKLFKKCQEIEGKRVFYIDGQTSGKKREAIKAEMEQTVKKVEYTILNFGDYEIEVKSDFEILLNNGKYKLAKDINIDDDINDKFINTLK